MWTKQEIEDGFLFVEEFLKGEPPITVGEGYKPDTTSLKNFIFWFIHKSPHTVYSPISTHNLHCRAGAYRSIGDIYLVALNYFPECRLLDIQIHIIELIYENKISWMFCHEIDKRVHISKIYGDTIDNAEESEYGIDEECLYKIKEIWIDNK